MAAKTQQPSQEEDVSNPLIFSFTYIVCLIISAQYVSVYYIPLTKVTEKNTYSEV